MSGAIPPLPQYAFIAWCSVEAQGQLYLYGKIKEDKMGWECSTYGKTSNAFIILVGSVNGKWY
jgi:hypothetical protein